MYFLFFFDIFDVPTLLINHRKIWIDADMMENCNPKMFFLSSYKVLMDSKPSPMVEKELWKTIDQNGKKNKSLWVFLGSNLHQKLTSLSFQCCFVGQNCHTQNLLWYMVACGNVYMFNPSTVNNHACCKRIILKNSSYTKWHFDPKSHHHTFSYVKFFKSAALCPTDLGKASLWPLWANLEVFQLSKKHFYMELRFLYFS